MLLLIITDSLLIESAGVQLTAVTGHVTATIINNFGVIL